MSARKPYAVVTVTPLNGGKGRVVKGFSRADFELWWQGKFTFPVPKPPNVASVGDCFIGFQVNFPENGDPLEDQQIVRY